MAPLSKQLNKLLFPVFILAGVATSVGCRNAAYSDLYVENMAAEIRDLEDQLYEYDNEYHVLEQQLQALRAENAQLRQSGSTRPATSPPATSPRGSGNSRSPQSELPRGEEVQGLEFTPRNESQPSSIEPLPRVQQESRSIIEPPGASLDPTEQQKLEDTLPPLPPKKPATEEINPSLLDIPTIDPGTPMPPPLPVRKDFTGSDRSQSHDMELNLSRIDVPAQLASDRGQAQLKLGSEKPSDMKVVEIAFHPSLTRAANFDDEPDDDGLYLVLQPKNVAGQMVPTPAVLDIAVLDPSREGDAARIGRWTYSAVEVKAKLQPIGSNQGIHLSLPWNGPDPAADRVIVFIRYTFPDGRQVVNDKHIFVSGKGSMKTVWVPRSTEGPVVKPASFEQLQMPNTNPEIPSNVIRPQSSSAQGAPEPAPLPSNW